MDAMTPRDAQSGGHSDADIRTQPHAQVIAPVILVLSASALATAGRIKAALPGASIHGLAKRLADLADLDQHYSDLGTHLRALYTAGIPIIGLCAAGILIRCLAPVIGARAASPGEAKTTEPPVLALAEDGSAVVPLLGGLSGVNTLARQIGAVLAVRPAITTSGELRFGTCLLSPPKGYVLADLEHGKHFVSDLLAGETLVLDSDIDLKLDESGSHSAPVDGQHNAPNGIRVGARDSHPHTDACVSWLSQHNLPFVTSNAAGSAETSHTVRVSVSEPSARQANVLTIHPRSVVVAIDRLVSASPLLEDPTPAETPAQAEAVTQLVQQVKALLASRNIALPCLAGLIFHSCDLTHPLVAPLAEALGVPARFYSPRSGVEHFPNEVAQAIGLQTGNNAAKPTVQIHRDEGMHLLQASTPVSIDTIGKTRGTLSVIGLGPGDKSLLAPAARDALASASDILGYATYVEMAGPFAPHQIRHSSDNREEIARARHAFSLAAEGRQVVMVSSGDPGVFAMAAAVLEALEEAIREDRAEASDWKAVLLEIVPGISAAFATAALAGAPLGHDFCMLSLSDNLKPWQIIEKRLRHAAQADLVMAFYNPISRARPWQLARALSVVRESRKPDTVVVLGRDIGRPAQSLRHMTLAQLLPGDVDMRTMVIIGSSTTRHFFVANPHYASGANADGEVEGDAAMNGATGKHWIYTPRSYPIDDALADDHSNAYSAPSP